MFNYKIIGQRGVLQNGTLFLLNEGKPLELHFDELPAGNYELVLHKFREAGVERTSYIKMSGDTVLIEANSLRSGIWEIELVRLENKKAVDKIVCTPIKVDTLATINSGLIAYPEIDDLIHRVADLTDKVAVLEAWVAENAPKIHEHHIVL